MSGVVTLDGKGLTEGVVQFYGPGDRLSTANIQPDGTFVATDVMPGEIQVAVVEDSAKSMDRVMRGGQADPSLGKASVTAKAPPIPAKYKDIKSSGLSYTITPNTERIEIGLSSK